MSNVTTLDLMLQPLMEGPSIKADRCVVCGARHPLEQHHVVPRGAGQLFEGGIAVPKPTLTLCGFGSNLGLSGRLLCHGMAHHRMLHFRFDAERRRWQYLRTARPVKYARALDMDGWRELAYYKFQRYTETA